MDRFEFLMVLLSIIIGLGISELLTNVARQIRARKTIRAFWAHSGVVALLFLAFLQIWWESWELQSVDLWTFQALLLMLAAPAGLFVISHLVYPEEIDGADLESYYFRNARVLWSMAALTVVAATGFRPLAFGNALLTIDNLVSFVMLGLFAFLATSKLRAAHLAAVPIIIVIMLLDILVFKPVL